MADFWKGLGGILKHPINEAKWMWDETMDVGKPLIKGDFGEAWDQLKGVPGSHQDMMSDTITVPLAGDNKLSRNSDAIAGAIVGGILAGGAMAGGAGAGGTGGGGTAGGFGGFGGFGGTGGGGGAMSGSGLGWQGGTQMGSLGPTFTPSTAFGGAGAGGGGGTGAMGLSTAYTPTTAFGQAAAAGGSPASGAAASQGFNWGKFAQMAQNLKTPEQQQPQVSMGAPQGGRWGGFNSKLYQNPLLEKEYMRIYTEPSFKQPK